MRKYFRAHDMRKYLMMVVTTHRNKTDEAVQMRAIRGKRITIPQQITALNCALHGTI